MYQLSTGAAGNLKNDVLSGLTVALALVPEAVAFAFVAGVQPLVGLYAAFMVGLITAVAGGRPGMISGATGAMAVVMVALVSQHGVEYLFATVILTGVLQMLAGAFKMGKFIRMVPHPVMLGFVNGLAIVIFLAQMSQFQTPDGNWLSGQALVMMLGLVGLTMAIIHFLPKLTTAIPAALVAIVALSLLVMGLDLDTLRVGDIAQLNGGLPSFHWPFGQGINPDSAAYAPLAGAFTEGHPLVPLTIKTLTIILPYAVILALIGLIESLLTLTLIDELTETRGQGNRECVGQGLANTVTGMFGGMGGCAMIGQSMININSGGRGRASGITAALALLGFIILAPDLIELIPIAALVGVMFIVVIGTFEWSSLRIIGKVPKADVFVVILVSAVTVATDLAIAVVVGVIVSALVFAWEHAKHVYADDHIDEHGSKIYELNGPLFFGSISHFKQLFDIANDPQDVIIDFRNSRVVDHSGLEAIDSLAERYLNAGKRLHLRHLSPECRTLLHRAGALVEVNVIEDPKYRIATDDFA
ncbi:SulP family inorganic anion transporter [Pelagibaculum spongiae]|uniref:Sodium-independent anion transporter n=1 Tax=Pelagibaculum spongiae TaxID=2080658 RepID=A0A2V1GQB0_9GAMM|nr:SulP family inorganic anion transporter [Pelagibaculum spongiae]PVZ65388.1 sodium-independent anion transporter [Pelagibaculum spongiae]